MKSVNNIRKITKAMKMISSMKMKGELRRLANGKNFGINSVEMVFKTDTYLQKKMVEPPANPRELLVPISSDRGLCGSINSGIVRDVRDYLLSRDRTRCEVFSIGDKAAAALSRNFKDVLKLGNYRAYSGFWSLARQDRSLLQRIQKCYLHRDPSDGIDAASTILGLDEVLQTLPNEVARQEHL